MKKAVVTVVIYILIIVGVLSFYTHYTIISKEDYNASTESISQKFGKHEDNTLRSMHYNIDELSYAEVVVDYNKTFIQDFGDIHVEGADDDIWNMIEGKIPQYSYSGIGVVRERVWLVRLDYNWNNSNKPPKDILRGLGYKPARTEHLLNIIKQFPIFAEKYCLIVLSTGRILKEFKSSVTYEAVLNGMIITFNDGSRRTYVNSNNTCSRSLIPHRYLALSID